MLDEPEAAAPRAAALDCRDRLPCAGKKLIQARLPFKRLSIPKVKSEARRPPCTSLEGKVPDLEPSLDNLEHLCHTASNLDLSPKLVNGRGPMDSFLGRMKPGQGVVIIDLTEDSNDLPEIPVASLAQATVNGVSLGPPEQQGPACAKDSSEEPVCPPEILPDIACPGKDKSRGLEGPGRTGSCQVGSLQSYPSPAAGPGLCPKTEKDGWSKAGGILFKEKLPVVLLQDILASKPPLAASPPSTPLDRSITSESELLESCPEDDFINSHSSLSSASPDSSPEGPEAAPPQHPWSSPPCTPVCRTPKRLVKGSTDKNKTRMQRDRVQLREEKEKLREEARRAREQARRKKEEEKELKEKEKAEKQRLKEEEKELKEKERREKREKDEKEKAEKQRLKEERRKERQEALEAKLEEKRKKEEEKRLREEEKRIKAEKAEITRFFQKPKTPQAPKTLAGSCGKFAPFEIKEHMVLAPQCRAVLDQDLCARLDQFLQQQNGSVSFLKDLKTRQPLTSGPTQSFGRDTGIVNRDVVIVDSIEVDRVPERRKFGRMKLLQFSENHRPAYWGTWNKKTAIIRPRDPWAQDKNLFDYEVDSDEEWEEEEPGESLSHSEGDEDDDVGEDEDEDDGFFVPHGYLSEDEGVTEECADPENQKVRQKLKAKEWDELLAKGKRFRVLQPVQVGCVWAAEVASSGADIRLLQQFSARLLDTAPSDDEPAPKASKREKDQQILAQLLPLLHGNVNGSKVIIQEFQEHCRRGLLSPRESADPQSPSSSPQSPDAMVPSKARLKRLISENSAYEKRPDFRMCWYVHPQVLRSFGQERLPVPCQWTYVTTSPVPREDSSVPAAGPSHGTPVLLKRKPGGSMCITQFMKKRRHEGQAVAGDMDGFQADTEEEEDDDDCMIVDGPDAEDTLEPCGAVGRLPTSLLGTS